LGARRELKGSRRSSDYRVHQLIFLFYIVVAITRGKKTLRESVCWSLSHFFSAVLLSKHGLNQAERESAQQWPSIKAGMLQKHFMLLKTGRQRANVVPLLAASSVT